MHRTSLAAAALVLASAMAAPAAAQQLPPSRAVLPAGTDTVEIPFELYRRWMMIDVVVEDSPPLRFILDTGAPITVLASLALGRTLPLEIVGEARIGGAGEGEAASVLMAGGVRFGVGELVIEGAPMAVGLGTDALAGADGVIGAPIFDNLIVEIDWVDQTLQLHAPDSWEAGPGYTSLPMRRTATGHLTTVAELSIAGEPAVDVELFVDTGAGHALSVELDGEHRLDAPDRLLEDVLIGWGANGAVYGDIGRVTELRLGEYALGGVVTSFPDTAPWSRIGAEPGDRVYGNLGAQVLQRFHVVVDVPNGWLHLRPYAEFDAPFRFDQAGMALQPAEPGALAITVADVVSGSPADEAGVQVGDEITAIDDRPVSELQPHEVQRILEGPSGASLPVTLRRGQEVIRTRLELRPLI